MLFACYQITYKKNNLILVIKFVEMN